MKQYDDSYSESLRKYDVCTDMSVLTKLRIVLKEIGLENLLKGKGLESKSVVQAILTALAERNLINEFCRIVTQKPEHDFMAEKAGTITWIIHDFFVDLYWQMPPSWRNQIKAWLRDLETLGKAMLTVGGKSQTPSSTVSG